MGGYGFRAPGFRAPSLVELYERWPRSRTKNFIIDKNTISEEDNKLLASNNFFVHDDLKTGYIEISVPNRYEPIYVFNKNTLEDILKLLKSGHTKDSQEILHLLYEKVDDVLYELHPPRLTSKRNISYASTSFNNGKRQIIKEYVDYFIMGDVPNGDLSSGRSTTYTVYKTLAGVKKAALEYVDKEIKLLNELKEQIKRD